MNRYYAYVYLAIFWSLRYVFPLLILAIALVMAFLGKWSIFAICVFLAGFDFVILRILKIPKRITSKEVNSNPLKNKKSDFLLIISLKRIKETSKKRRFGEQDWSLSWVNTLTQEAGVFSVIDADELRASDIYKSRVIILSKSAIEHFNAKLVFALEKFVGKGGILVLEQPSNEFENLSGITCSNKKFNSKSITYIDNSYKGFEALKGMPLHTSLCELTSIKNDSKILVSFDEGPAIIQRDNGKGAVLTICFDFGLQLIAMQQGIPLDNYVVRDKTSLKDFCESQDLILDKSMEDSNYPFADIMEKLILEIIEKKNPVPRLWYLKDYYSGAFIMTHDEDYFGDGIKYMVDYEKKINAKSTFFIAPSTKISKSVARLLCENSEFAVHWDRMRYFLFSLFGKTSNDEKHLKDQIGVLESHYKRNIITNRNHFLKWDSHYTNTFRLLHKNNIKVDSTYGPNDGKGYLFGTCYAFFPLDTNGLVIPLLEVPFQTQDARRGVDTKYIDKIIKNNKLYYHGFVVLLFHPQKCLPESEANSVWLDSYKPAIKNNQWIADFQEIYSFFSERQKSYMTSEFSDNKLMISLYTKRQTIAVPYRHAQKKVKAIKLDRKRINDYKLVSIMNFRNCLVKMPKGKHELEIIYG